VSAPIATTARAAVPQPEGKAAANELKTPTVERIEARNIVQATNVMREPAAKDVAGAHDHEAAAEPETAKEPAPSAKADVTPAPADHPASPAAGDQPSANSQPYHASAAAIGNDAPQPPPNQNAAANQSSPAVAAAAPVQHPAPAHTAGASEAPVRVDAGNDAANVSPGIEALGMRIAAKAADNTHHFDIRLDPPELGRIDVRLDVDNSGRANAQLTTDQPQTLQMLQRDHHELARTIRDAGLDLGSMSFSLKGEQQRSAMPQQIAQQATAASAPKPVSTPAPIARWTSHDNTRVDIRV
jgi:flagellar hook-length control protein FliK